MTDDRIESQVRSWLVAHTEPDVPVSLRRFLADLPTTRPGLDRVERTRPTPIVDRHRRGALPALVACAVIVAVAVALGFGLDRRPGPSVGISPLPSVPQRSPAATAPPPRQATTPVVDAAPVDADHGWALTHGDLVWTSDAGASWASIRPADVDVSMIRAVHFLSPISGWLVWWTETSGAVTVERTSDGGHTWTASHLPTGSLDNGGNVSIDAIDGGTVWIQVEATHSSASSIGSLYLSRDGGISWVPGITIPGGWPIRFVSGMNGWTTARPLRDELDATTDGGRTWHPVPIDRPPGHAQDALSFDLPTFVGDVGIPGTGVLPVTLYAPLDPSGADQTATLALYATHDGGATWQFATTVGATTGLSQPLTIASAILDQGTWLVAPDPQRPLSRTIDGGRTWTDIPSSSITGRVNRFRFVDPANGWALTQPEGADFQLSAAIDGGRTWRSLDPVANASVVPSPVASLAAGPYRWTLVNSEGALATYSVGQVIRRTDGAYRTRLPDDPSFARAGMRRMAMGGNGFVVFGQVADPNAYADADLIWVADPR